MKNKHNFALPAELHEAYLLRMPAAPRRAGPVIFNSPHSGSVYPKSFIDASQLDALSLRNSEDAYVDQLFAEAPLHGAPLLSAAFPRAYLDLNREPFELDPKLFDEPLPSYANTRSQRVQAGLGTVARRVNENQEIYKAPLALNEALMRIERLYMPYHNQLTTLIDAAHQRHDMALLIDCHSMPSNLTGYSAEQRPGAASSASGSEEEYDKPDFVIGTRYGQSCSPYITEFISDFLKSKGYVLAHNRPYAGGYITEHYGKPQHERHCLQIEINRGLYMNEQNFEKLPYFDDLKADLTSLIAALCAKIDQILVDNKGSSNLVNRANAAE